MGQKLRLSELFGKKTHCSTVFFNKFIIFIRLFCYPSPNWRGHRTPSLHKWWANFPPPYSDVPVVHGTKHVILITRCNSMHIVITNNESRSGVIWYYTHNRAINRLDNQKYYHKFKIMVIIIILLYMYMVISRKLVYYVFV